MAVTPTYCPDCGSALSERTVEGRERAFCEDCEQPVYRNPKPCAGPLVVDGDRVLLVKRTEPPAVGAWSVPAGYLEVDEPPAEAAARELEEETGVRVAADALALLDTNLVSHADGSHVLVLVYRVPRSATAGDPVAGSDAAAARFWSLSELRASDEQLEPGYEGLLERALAAT